MMGLLKAVDPGVAYHALAEFSDCALTHVELVLNETLQAWPRVGLPIFTLVMEKPQVYASGKARKSDIVDLSIASGRIAQAMGASREVWYTPAQWKGQIDKKPHHKRIRGRLSEKELALIAGKPQKELVHIMDAIGLGLFHLGRM